MELEERKCFGWHTPVADLQCGACFNVSDMSFVVWQRDSQCHKIHMPAHLDLTSLFIVIGKPGS